MVIEVIKYSQVEGITIWGVEPEKAKELVEYLDRQGYSSLLSHNYKWLAVFKTFKPRGLFNRQPVKTDCPLDELMPHLEAFFIDEELSIKLDPNEP